MVIETGDSAGVNTERYTVLYFAERAARYLSYVNQQTRAAPARSCCALGCRRCSTHRPDPQHVGHAQRFIPHLPVVPAREQRHVYTGFTRHVSTADLQKPRVQAMHRIYTGLFVFNTEKGFQVLLSFRDEKEPVTVPDSQLHL